MAKGGARKGAGRKPGTLNKRTQERIAAFRDSGKKDPLDSLADLHELALRAHKQACQALAKFEKDYAKALEALDAIPGFGPAPKVALSEEAAKALTQRRAALRGEIDKLHAQIAARANEMNPYLHSRLALSEGTLDVSTHEAALDELDD